MKRKFYLLALVFAVAGTSVISSCKDTDEDLRNEMSANRSQIEALKSELSALKSKVDGLSNCNCDMSSINAEIKKVSDALASYKTLTDTDITSLSEDIKKIKDQLSNLSSAVTGVLLQASENPMFGSLNTPFGVNSMVLLAYYNEAVASPIFPTEFLDGYTGPEYRVTSGEMLISDAKDNAGTLYLTVNPSNADFSGVNLDLVNSQDKVSGVKLSALKKSDKVLSFGYTRAADNGFYEATASVTEEGILNGSVQTVDLNAKAVGKDLKNLLNGRPTMAEIVSLVGDVYKAVDKVADANAVKIVRGEGLGNVYSEYGVAAVAFKPLSFNTLDGVYTSDKMPGYGTIENAIDRIVSSVKINLNLKQFNVKEFNLHKIEIADDENFTIHFVYNGDNCTSTVSKKEVFGDIFDNLNADLDRTKQLADQVNDMLKEYNSINDKLSGSINIKDDVMDLLDKVNSQVVNLINKAMRMLKPCLALNTNDGARLASGSSAYPTVISGTKVTLIPTSYTFETLAPALKKYVAVKNLSTGAEVVGENLGTLIDGTVRAIDVNLQSGNSYEITYLALDYTGQVENHKYYVTVK